MKLRDLCALLSLAVPLIGTAAEPNMSLVEGLRLSDCQTLTGFRAQQEDLYRRTETDMQVIARTLDPEQRKPIFDEWEAKKATQRASFNFVYKEKQCASSPGTQNTPGRTKIEPVPVAATAEPAESGAPVVTGRPGHLGVALGSVDATSAKALGLSTPRGAMVVELDAPAPSGGTGLKPLDVVLEIAGQAVMQPADLQGTVQRMRPGYKAPLRIWRDRAERDLLVVIGAAPPALQRAVIPTALPPASASQAIAPPAGTPRFCYAFLVQIGKPGGVQSSIWEERGPEFGHAAMQRSMAGFATHMRQVQPGSWHDDIPAGKCSPGSNQCLASSTRTFGASQHLSLFCHETPEQAEEARKRQGIGLSVFEWAPSAVP